MSDKTLGTRIAELRVENGFSQQELADLIGVNSAKVISSWENGVHNPSAKQIRKLCEELHCSPSYFIPVKDYESDLSPVEIRMIRQFRELSEGQQVAFYNFMKSMNGNAME